MSDERSLVKQTEEEVSEEHRTGELVPQTAGKAVVVEVDREVPDLGAAVAQLSSVIGSINADDVSFEFSQDNSAQRSTTRLRLRAYRKT
jgi:hypothetical protein